MVVEERWELRRRNKWLGFFEDERAKVNVDYAKLNTDWAHNKTQSLDKRYD